MTLDQRIKDQIVWYVFRGRRSENICVVKLISTGEEILSPESNSNRKS